MSTNVNSLVSSLPAYPMFFLSLVLVIYKSNAYDRCPVREKERDDGSGGWIKETDTEANVRTYNRG